MRHFNFQNIFWPEADGSARTRLETTLSGPPRLLDAWLWSGRMEGDERGTGEKGKKKGGKVMERGIADPTVD